MAHSELDTCGGNIKLSVGGSNSVLIIGVGFTLPVEIGERRVVKLEYGVLSTVLKSWVPGVLVLGENLRHAQDIVG